MLSRGAFRQQRLIQRDIAAGRSLPGHIRRHAISLHPVPGFHVAGRTVTYQYSDPWGLLALLRDQDAKLPSAESPMAVTLAQTVTTQNQPSPPLQRRARDRRGGRRAGGIARIEEAARPRDGRSR